MRREIVEEVYRVYIWEVARAVGNEDLKRTLHVLFELDEGLSQHIDLTLSKTNFGGARLWFVCPACRRRVGTLYCLLQDLRFSCRHCHDLRYEVQTRHRDKFYETVGRPLKKLKALKRNEEKDRQEIN